LIEIQIRGTSGSIELKAAKGILYDNSVLKRRRIFASIVDCFRKINRKNLFMRAAVGVDDHDKIISLFTDASSVGSKCLSIAQLKSEWSCTAYNTRRYADLIPARIRIDV
jgi:hypothetical protein